MAFLSEPLPSLKKSIHVFFPIWCIRVKKEEDRQNKFGKRGRGRREGKGKRIGRSRFDTQPKEGGRDHPPSIPLTSFFKKRLDDVFGKTEEEEEEEGRNFPLLPPVFTIAAGKGGRRGGRRGRGGIKSSLPPVRISKEGGNAFKPLSRKKGRKRENSFHSKIKFAQQKREE